MMALPTLPATHPVLGSLRHDGDGNPYSGHVTMGDADIAFRLKPDKNGDFAHAEKRASRFASNVQTEIDAVSEFLADRYLELLNGEWAEPGRRTVSLATFLSVIKPGAVTFYGDGTAEFLCVGGKLFTGHCLIARSRSNGALFHAELAG